MIINERITFERILCPIDLSPDSDEALRYAMALARAYDAKLFVCHCLPAQVFADEAEQSRIAERVKSEARSRGGPFDTPAYECLVVEGEPAVAIKRVAAERRIDLIVMRSRRRPSSASLLGSTAEAVCRTAPCPALVTHPNEHGLVDSSTGEIDINRVLVAYDFSGDSELALLYGLSLAQEYQAELHLIHVLPPHARQEAPELAVLPMAAGSAFYDTAQRLRTTVPVEAHLWCSVKNAVREGRPYREILAYAEESAADLICMGASGTGFGMRALFGSNADRVLRQSPCPILIARPLRPISSPDDKGAVNGNGIRGEASRRGD